MIIVPHYTGEYFIVDCDRYKILPEIMEMYDDRFIKENKDNNVEYDGETYFYAEYSPMTVDEHWDKNTLLSYLNLFYLMNILQVLLNCYGELFTLLQERMDIVGQLIDFLEKH